MVDPNTRSGKRTPVTLKIKFKSETLEQFIERYAVDVSQGGIFIRTKEPLAVGTQMKFEFQLKDASPLIAGEGTVVWTRENDPSRPAIAPGMGVRFDKLADGSQGVLERILAEKAKQAPQRPNKESTKPPMFTDTPTRVAPAPMQEALLGNAAGAEGGPSGPPRRKRPDSQEEKTPLPKPMPFHSDADDFSEEAFEEATKVRALDELVAQTALAEGKAKPVTPDDELAARRNNLFKDDKAPAAAPTPPTEAKTPAAGERDSAPGLPSPPVEVGTPAGAKPLDTTPSPRETASPALSPAKTQLGMTPAAAATGGAPRTTDAPPVKRDAPTVPSGIIPVQPEPKERTAATTPVVPASAQSSGNLPAAGKRPSSAPIVIGIILFVAAAGAALWFFVLREPAVEVAKPRPTPGSAGSDLGSAAMTQPGSAGSDVGSAGSAVVDNGSAGSAAPTGSNGSGSATPAVATTIDSVITVTGPDKPAAIEVVGTEQKGASPFTAKLEKDKPYKLKLSAPGYVTQEVDVKGGEAKVAKKLEAKKYIITITSNPAGAAVAFDGTIAKSPYELKVAPKKPVKVRVAKAGFKVVDLVIDADKWTEDDKSMTYTQDVTLVAAPVAPPTGNGGNGNTTPPPDKGSAATPPPDKGSAATPPPDKGSGSAETPPPPPPPPPAGGGAGSSEPAPEWSK